MSTLINLTPPTIRYSVTTDTHPGALPRVLELFALRNITPDLVRVSKFKPSPFQSANLNIDVQVKGLSPEEQEIILQKLNAQVSVHYVREEILFQKSRAKLVS